MQFETVDERGNTKKENLPFISKPPLAVAILAAQELSKGKNISQIREAVKEAVAANPELAADDAPLDPTPAKSQEVMEEEEGINECGYRYNYALARLVTGQIHGLNDDEIDDVAKLVNVPHVNFDTWMRRKQYRG